ncbi:uncharacterized protein LOC109950859 [Prunus persica]|uniref:uncharacterized protein LOC109950859 n=1 Tax=Prunus persica TaxID=3760 RepID=UPI0009AB58C6|nr:uncharacterized protein LOC109950859 [Prunus persica]
MTAPSSDPPAPSASASTAPALMEHVLVGPGASQAHASSASSVAQPASARRRHRPADTTDTTSTDGTGASGSQPAKKNTRGPCRQLKTAKVTRTNYNLEDLDEESLATGGRASGSDVGDSTVPCTGRLSNPAVSCVDLPARPPRACPPDHCPSGRPDHCPGGRPDLRAAYWRRPVDFTSLFD